MNPLTLHCPGSRPELLVSCEYCSPGHRHVLYCWIRKVQAIYTWFSLFLFQGLRQHRHVQRVNCHLEHLILENTYIYRTPMILVYEILFKMDKHYPGFLRRSIMWYALAFKLVVNLGLEPWCPGPDHQGWPPLHSVQEEITYSTWQKIIIFLICCLMLAFIQRISQSLVSKADLPAYLPDVEIKHMTGLQMGYILPWCSQTHLTSLWFLVCLWHWTVLSYRAIICSRLRRVK